MYKIGIITLGAAGLKTFNLGTTSTPYALSIIVQNKSGIAEATKHISIGSATENGQRVTSYVKNGTSYNFDTTTKCVSHYELPNGVPTEVLSAIFDSFTATGFKLNVTIPNTAYDVYVRVDY